MAYEIELTAPSLSKFERTLDQSLEKADRLATKMENLGAASRAASSESVGSSGDARRSARAFMTMESLKGPYARAETAGTRLSYYSANNIGGAQLQDAQLEAARAQRAVMKAEKEGKPLSRGDAINDLLMTSRLSVSDGGVSMMPLVNRMMSYRSASALFGEGAGGAIAGLAGPLAGAAAAIYGMTAAANAYTGFVRDAAGAHYIGGGNSRGTASLMNLGALAGSSGSEMAQRAVQFGDFLRSGDPAAGYFRMRGLVDRGWFQTDKASNFAAGARFIMDPNTPEDLAIRMARRSGMEDFLQKRDMDPELREELLNTFAPMSAGDRRNSANYQGKWDLLQTRTKRDVLNPMGRWAQSFMGRMVPDVANPKASFGDMLLTASGFGLLKDAAAGFGFGGGDKPNSPTSKLVQAAEALTDAGRSLKQSAESIGAGPRARGAYPKAWQNALQMEDALTGQAAMLGAFSI